jgi:hypothetical protein
MTRLHLVALLFGIAVTGVAQENPGQMGTQPQPSVTNPANAGAQTQRAQPLPKQNAPANPQKPTVPTTPQARPAGSEATDVDKPESAVGGTTARPTPPQALPSESANQNAGALQLVQPNAEELRNRIETALRREPSLSSTNIVLNISDDTIDITGNANTPKERITARRIVQSFAGNRRVRERITVAGITRAEPQQDQIGAPNGPGATHANPNPSVQNPPQPNPDQPKPEDAQLQKEAAKKGDASGEPREPR